jgi:hypothetical protein
MGECASSSAGRESSEELRRMNAKKVLYSITGVLAALGVILGLVTASLEGTGLFNGRLTTTTFPCGSAWVSNGMGEGVAVCESYRSSMFALSSSCLGLAVLIGLGLLFLAAGKQQKPAI